MAVNWKSLLVAVYFVLALSIASSKSNHTSVPHSKNLKENLLHIVRSLRGTGKNNLSSKLFNQLPANVESKYTPPQVIANRGYRVETHRVTTEDGYILELHRIPAAGVAKKAVYLQHGVLFTSGIWLLSPTSRSLPFVLADKGYDVWMGNFRGNRYSRAHVSLDPNGADFWKFSWDEIGRYDLPAAINYVLTTTGQAKLSYIGHSLGSGSFFIAMITHPELNSKIEIMVGLAPLSAFTHFRSILKVLFPFQRMLRTALNLAGTRVFLDNDFDRSGILKLSCEQTYTQARKCINFVNIVAGPSAHFDPEIIPQFDANVLSGTSVDVMVQFAQNYNAGEVFQAFDYGRRENLRRYGTAKPPVYDLSKVTAPVYVFWGANDYIVAPKDILWLLTQLGNIKGDKEILGYAHGDFVWGDDVKTQVYDPILALLPPA